MTPSSCCLFLVGFDASEVERRSAWLMRIKAFGYTVNCLECRVSGLECRV